MQSSLSISLSKLSAGLRVKLIDLMVLAGRVDEQELHGASVQVPAPMKPMNPLAVELDRMLRLDSHLDDVDRAALAHHIDRTIEPYRKIRRRRRAG